MRQHEMTPLISKTPVPTWREYVQPGLMGLASFANVVGGFFAIASGADNVKGDDGEMRTNPFFYTAMSTSILYASANAYEMYRIYNKQQDSWRQIVEEERAQSELKEIQIAK